MKAIKICAPLMLILAVACDDNNEVVELDNETNQARWTPQERPLKTVEDHVTARAAHLVKAHRAVTQFVRSDILNPFVDESAIADLLPNCSVEKSTELTDTVSSCDNMATKSFVMDIVDCDFGDGDIYSGSVLVSSSVLDIASDTDGVSPVGTTTLAEQLELTDTWLLDVQLDSVSGTTIDACGVATTSLRENTSQMMLNISHPTHVDADGNPTGAIYEASTEQKIRAHKFNVVKSHIELMDSSAPEYEVGHMRIRGNYDANSLLPKNGSAAIKGRQISRIHFNSRQFGPDTVAAETTFHGFQLVEVPTL